jgi:hypothetical protein
VAPVHVGVLPVERCNLLNEVVGVAANASKAIIAVALTRQLGNFRWASPLVCSLDLPWFTYCVSRLRNVRGIEGPIDLTAHPESMEQNGQLPGNGNDGPLFCCLSTPFGQP